MTDINKESETEKLNPTSRSGHNQSFIIIDSTKTQLNEKPLGLRYTAVFRQLLIVFIANLSLLAPAMGLAYPGVTQGQLTDNKEPFHLNDSEASWFASINAIACPVGGLLCACLLDKFGRKSTIFVINIISTVSWALMGSSYYNDWRFEFTQVIIARFIIGIASGLASSAVSVYSAEICHPAFRGRLTLGSSAATATGIFAMFTIGYVIREDWRLIAQIACGFSLFTFAITFLIPESPSWLMVNNRMEDSRKSLKFFLGLKSSNGAYSEEFEQEFNILKKSHTLAEGENAPKFIEAFQSPDVYKPLLIMIGFFAFQQLSGIFVVVVYAVQIAIKAGVTIDPILCAMLLSFIRVPFTFAVGLVLDRWGRRPPAMFSGLGMGISMLILASSIWFPIVGRVPFLPVICLTSYIITSTIGLMTLPFSMIGEVFPQRMRGTAAGITISCNYTMSFVCVKLFPTMVASMGEQNVFAFYGTSSFLAIIYVYLFLPETKGKTLIEISEEFKGSSRMETSFAMNKELKEQEVY